MTDMFKYTTGVIALSFMVAGCGGIGGVSASGAANKAEKACTALLEEYDSELDVDDDEIADACKCMSDNVKVLIRKDDFLAKPVNVASEMIIADPDVEKWDYFDPDKWDTYSDEPPEALVDMLDDLFDPKEKLSMSAVMGAGAMSVALLGCEDVRDKMQDMSGSTYSY